jgi:hypothetical protein
MKTFLISRIWNQELGTQYSSLSRGRGVRFFQAAGVTSPTAAESESFDERARKAAAPKPKAPRKLRRLPVDWIEIPGAIRLPVQGLGEV